MRILLTNDDGIHAPGLKVLEEIARELSDDIWVVAPSEEQSGAGHSLTLTVPVRLREHGERRYAVVGTPTDSVMMALGHVMKDVKPDLVLSGVNRGGNLAEDVTYSGTVSAAMEGTLYGVRSIALSQVMMDLTGLEAFETARAWGAKVLRPLLEMGDWGKGVLLNVNFPPVPAGEVTGVRVAEQGFRDLGQTAIEQRKDTRGFDYFWFGLGRESPQPGHETDLKAMREGAVSVTPLHLDLTHYPTMDKLRSALSGK
ncbi:5'/3'-nucleotidase SurE [Pacificimonas flava]|uniref:5'-nucleotidase SurE n=2 Tax=Pacificimonas TaxID=1960290 RepID=A0A219B374_9SPHN|nr:MULTISPECIES: 5'/3'-nucleotidase SurE [Pacificimonas]MBZ6377516.1 5'/3'-nucleotidase SurE [Pacificimonas aurantium]OWV32790.1 5'/3'-nucleotidase SurE [Pacificimonas flava]